MARSVSSWLASGADVLSNPRTPFHNDSGFPEGPKLQTRDRSNGRGGPRIWRRFLDACFPPPFLVEQTLGPKSGGGVALRPCRSLPSLHSDGSRRHRHFRDSGADSRGREQVGQICSRPPDPPPAPVARHGGADSRSSPSSAMPDPTTSSYDPLWPTTPGDLFRAPHQVLAWTRMPSTAPSGRAGATAMVSRGARLVVIAAFCAMRLRRRLASTRRRHGRWRADLGSLGCCCAQPSISGLQLRLRVALGLSMGSLGFVLRPVRFGAFSGSKGCRCDVSPSPSSHRTRAVGPSGRHLSCTTLQLTRPAGT